jgi:hypothetical protein
MSREKKYEPPLRAPIAVGGMSSSEGGSYSGFFESAVAIVEAAKKMDIQLRLLGATAIYYQCPKSNLLGDLLKRRLTDLDFMTISKYVSRIPELFSSLKFVPNERVNTLYGANRQIYSDPGNSRHVDVFFDRLSFNHVLDLTRRLDLDPVTISLADLLLEKLQIVKISEKDVKDVVVLMREHGLGDGSPGQLDARYVTKLLASDWGFYYTATTNIKKVRDYLDGIQSLSPADKELVTRRLDDLAQKIESEPKSFKWNLRARLGTRILWYTEAEDVEFRQ